MEECMFDDRGTIHSENPNIRVLASRGHTTFISENGAMLVDQET